MFLRAAILVVVAIVTQPEASRFVSMEETIMHFERSVAEYFGELPPTGAGELDPKSATEEPTVVTTPKP